MKNRALLRELGLCAAVAFALFFGVCNVANANITLVPYTTEFYRVGGLQMMEFPFRPPMARESAPAPETSQESAPMAPAAVEGPRAADLPMAGATPPLSADGFIKRQADTDGVMTGRSAFVAPTIAACALVPGPTAAQGDSASRLVFDPYPARCGEFDAKPFGLSGRW